MHGMAGNEVIDLCSPPSGGAGGPVAARRSRRIAIPSFDLGGSSDDSDEDEVHGSAGAPPVEIGVSEEPKAAHCTGICAHAAEEHAALSPSLPSSGVQQHPTRRVVIPSFDLHGSSSDSCDGSGNEEQACHCRIDAGNGGTVASQEVAAAQITWGRGDGELTKPVDLPIPPIRASWKLAAVAGFQRAGGHGASRKASGAVFEFLNGRGAKEMISNDALPDDQMPANAETKKKRPATVALKWSNMWRKREHGDKGGERATSRRQTCAGAPLPAGMTKDAHASTRSHSAVTPTTLPTHGRGLGAAISLAEAEEAQGLARGPAGMRDADSHCEAEQRRKRLKVMESVLWGATPKRMEGRAAAAGAGGCGRGGGKAGRGKSSVMTLMAKDRRYGVSVLV
jgi:hypothetical protein